MRRAVRLWRNVNRWDQEEMATRLRAEGWATANPTTISKIETGTRGVKVQELIWFAGAFSIAPQVLLIGMASDNVGVVDMANRIVAPHKAPGHLISMTETFLAMLAEADDA